MGNSFDNGSMTMQFLWLCLRTRKAEIYRNVSGKDVVNIPIVQFILKSLRNVAPVSLFLNVALPSFELKGFLICPNVI